MNAAMTPVPERLPTRMTELLGIRWPLLLGGMMWLSDARLVAAMVRAGGSYATDEAFRKALRECRRLTEGAPFGVNLTLSRRAANNEVMHGRLQVALQEGVRIFETAGLPPTDLLPAMRDAGAIVVHKCAHVRHAVAAEKMGVHAVTLVGMEEGGHPGNNQLPTFLNGSYALERLSIPLVIGGGIGHGRQIAAALALGADAVMMGSVFTAAEETPAHDDYKQRVIATDEHGTRAVLGSLGDTWRIIDNENARKVAALEEGGARRYQDFGELISGDRTKALAYVQGLHERSEEADGDRVAKFMALPAAEPAPAPAAAPASAEPAAAEAAPAAH